MFSYSVRFNRLEHGPPGPSVQLAVGGRQFLVQFSEKWIQHGFLRSCFLFRRHFTVSHPIVNLDPSSEACGVIEFNGQVFEIQAAALLAGVMTRNTLGIDNRF